ADHRRQLLIALVSRRQAAVLPVIESRTTYRQHLADVSHGKVLADRNLFDCGEDVGYPSRPKMLNAFFKMSRSRSTRRSSSSSRRTRCSRSEASAFLPPRNSFFQRYSVLVAEIPSRSQTDRAVCPSSNIRTASSLNSSVNP